MVLIELLVMRATYRVANANTVTVAVSVIILPPCTIPRSRQSVREPR